MSKIDLNIPALSDKFVDLRDIIPGDSYNWSWTRPLSQVNYLAIHHTASPDTQTPNQIANFHIHSNGWGGIGYHFLVDKAGIVYYVGDISLARANVANLNEQVIGICLIGNFTNVEPPQAQIDSARILCDFFINSYPALSNLSSPTVIRGHKELPSQSTACPGATWLNWKSKITNIVGGGTYSSVPTPILIPTPASSPDRGAQISELYRKVLGRDPDISGLQTYTNGSLTISQIMQSMIDSAEHQTIISLSKEAQSLKSQNESLQNSLSIVNAQLINLQQKLSEKESPVPVPVPVTPLKKDTTLTIAQALFNLYRFIFVSPRPN